MRLSLETITGDHVQVDIEPTETVLSVKHRIQRLQGQRATRLQLILEENGGETVLDNRKVVNHYKISEDSKIRMQPRLSGGDEGEIVCLCGISCLIILIVSSSLMGVSYSTVNPRIWGFDFNHNTQDIDWNVYGQGRYYLGVSHNFKRVKRGWVKELLDTMHGRTYDGLSCSFEISFNYEVQIDKMQEIYNTYGMKYEDLAIIPIARSRLRDVIAQYTAFELVKLRDFIARDMESQLDYYLNDVWINCRDLQLRSINWPDSIEDAIIDTTVALQDVYTAESEYKIAAIQAQTEIIAAKKLAQGLIFDANATAEATIADGIAEAAAILSHATAEANWMAYASATGEYVSAFNSTNNVTSSYRSTAGTDFDVPDLLDYTFLKYVVKTGLQEKVMNVKYPMSP